MPTATASRRTISRRSNISSRIADSHADENPGTPQARFVANAFVALGHYYLDGIPNTAVSREPERAREMFAYAASYFGDPDAQFQLGALYLDGNGAPRDPAQAARWLGLSPPTRASTRRRRCSARMLFKGEHVPRQAARGLMWLTARQDSAGAEEAWITELYDSAMQQASDDERALALSICSLAGDAARVIPAATVMPGIARRMAGLRA